MWCVITATQIAGHMFFDETINKSDMSMTFFHLFLKALEEDIMLFYASWYCSTHCYYSINVSNKVFEDRL
jgi:hypothetical protein